MKSMDCCFENQKSFHCSFFKKMVGNTTELFLTLTQAPFLVQHFFGSDTHSWEKAKKFSSSAWKAQKNLLRETHSKESEHNQSYKHSAPTQKEE